MNGFEKKGTFMNKEKECPHCKFLDNLFKGDIKNNREYWIFTEIFVYLHNGKDYCNFKKKENIKEV